MRTIRRGLAATVSVALAALTVLPAGLADAATPQPRKQEWWFSSWGIEKMAWPQSTGQGVTVAVLDSGVSAGVPELKGVVVPGTDVTGKHPGDGTTDVDQGEKGFPQDAGHGTAMAALIAGQGGGSGMVGVAPGAKIMPVITNDGFEASYTKAIRYAVDHGAQVISISLVSPATKNHPCGWTNDLQSAIAYAVQKNVVVVAAAGNDGQSTNDIEMPASCAGVLAVGAVDNKKNIWPDTQRQSYISVAAPGWGVGSINKRGQFINNISGTSQATALTAGAVALVRAKYPNLSAREIVQRIINTAVPASPANNIQTGAGIVLPPPALTKDVDKNAPNPPFERLDKWLASQGKSSAPATAPSSKASTGAAKSSSGSNTLIFIVIGVVVLLAIGLGIFLLSRRKKSTPPPQQYAGPPPSFGPPNQGGQPYQGQQPASQQRPNFLPPEPPR